MAKKEKTAKIGSASDVQATGAQFKLAVDFLQKYSKGVYTDNQIKKMLNKQNPFATQGDITVPEGMDPEYALGVLFAVQDSTIGSFLEKENLLKKWRSFYERFFSEIPAEKLDFLKLKIPERPEGFARLIVIVEGLTRNQLFNKCREKFGVWKYYDDLDAEVISIRTTEKAYAIWVRDRVEADEENKGISYDACQKSEDIQIKEGITLEERLLFELIYWDETGKHLDIKNRTLCSGSRYRSGSAVIVRWNSGGRLSVSRTNSDDDDGNLRPRSAVFLKLPEAA